VASVPTTSERKVAGPGLLFERPGPGCPICGGYGPSKDIFALFLRSAGDARPAGILHQAGGHVYRGTGSVGPQPGLQDQGGALPISHSRVGLSGKHLFGLVYTELRNN